MSLKINRRVFVVSTLGYVYYIKIDDGSVIKRVEIVLSGRELSNELGKGQLLTNKANDKASR